MTASSHEIIFNGEMLARGFWLYVWDITTPQKRHLYYVGRTGDSSSNNAQSPFNRMGQHLGSNAKNNVLRHSLESKDVDPESCAFRLVAHGPILPEAGSLKEHMKSRDSIAAMEKALALALTEAGYEVMNKIHCRMSLDPKAFAVVRTAFAKYFKDLAIEKTAVAATE
jgi:hypothetical protein